MGHLKSLTLLGLAALLLAGPTFAQTVQLQLMNEGPGNQIGGDYTYPYNFSINGSASYTPLFCDDYLRNISNGESWTANVYSLTSPLTTFGQSSQYPGYTPAQTYEAAAIILSEVLNNTVPGANGNAALASEYGNLAVWAMFDSGAQTNSGYDPAIITPIIMNALNSTGQYNSSFYSQFSVYTPTDLAQNGPQEFIGYTPGSASIKFLGGGSSAMFLELGQAAQSSSVTNTPCVWTDSSLLKDAGAQDSRPVLDSLLPVVDYGPMWITWSPGYGTCAAPAGNFDVYAYTSLDSVLGDRCFFEVDDASGDSGCVQIISVAAGTAGSNLLCLPSPTNCTSFGPDTAIPQAVITALQLQHWFAAGTDILPQDAKFALLRMFTPCGQPIWRQPFDQGLRQTWGLGYQDTIASIGLPVMSYFRNFSFNTLEFNFIGNDPINTAFPVPQYSLTTLGAKPILVAVSPAGGPGIGAATDIIGFTLALFEEGTLGRNTDLIGPTVTAPITTLLNEPFSGPYNVMEYSVPNSSQFHTSQDVNNCGGPVAYSNPMYLQSTNGAIPAVRVRVLGTCEMVTQIQAGTASDQRLGYFYWSSANASTFTTTNGKYLTVNGVDPIQDTYTDGVLPGVDAAHPLSNVTFRGLNTGDYPIWSVLRIISKVPTPIGVTNLTMAAQGLNVTQHNFIDTATLSVWHSHYYLPVTGSGVAALGNTINTSGDLCPIPGALPEYGGDLGGANVLKQANVDFCLDFGNINGLINKAN
ncbi:MAG: hypothetical protein ACLPXB_15375 [Thiobacillaceae bacterium]